MAFSLTFHTLKEKLPKHEEEIMFFSSGLTMSMFATAELYFGNFYLVWHLLDENGLPSGTIASYLEGETWDENFTSINPSDDDGVWELGYQVDYNNDVGQVFDMVKNLGENIHWLSCDEFFEILPDYKI